MNNLLKYLPEIQGEEFLYLEKMCEQMDESQLQQFAVVYRSRRRDPQNVLLLCLVGFLGFSGLHRFYINDMVMGILYFLTAGFCMIGTIIDLINHKDLAFEYNRNVANEVVQMV